MLSDNDRLSTKLGLNGVSVAAASLLWVVPTVCVCYRFVFQAETRIIVWIVT